MKLSKEIKTAIVGLVGIFLFIIGFSFLKSNPIFNNDITLFAVYENVGGLQTGTPVTINGYTVGKVNNIKFKDERGNLLVTFTVNSDFKFSKNSLVELYDTGIIGGKGLQVRPVFDGARSAQKHDTLSTSVRPGITDLVQEKLGPLQVKVEGAISNADSLLMNVNDVLDAKTKRGLRESIVKLNVTLTEFQGIGSSFNVLLEKNKYKLDSSLTNLNVMTANFAKLSEDLAQSDLKTTMANLQTTIKDLNGVLAKVESGEGSLGKLLKNEDLYNNLSNASRELDLLLQDFRLNPKRYVNVSVFGKKQKEYIYPENDPAVNTNK